MVERVKQMRDVLRDPISQCSACGSVFLEQKSCPHCGSYNVRRENEDWVGSDVRRLADELEEIRQAYVDAKAIDDEGLPVFDDDVQAHVSELEWEHRRVEREEPELFTDAMAYWEVMVLGNGREQICVSLKHRAARYSPMPRARMLLRPRARRSRRVVRVAKTAGGDSGDPDPEPPSRWRFTVVGRCSTSTLTPVSRRTATPPPESRSRRWPMMVWNAACSPRSAPVFDEAAPQRQAFSKEKREELRPRAATLRPLGPLPVCGGVPGRMKDVAASLPWPAQALVRIPEKLRRAAPRPGRYSAGTRSAGQLDGINGCTHAMLAAEYVFFTEQRLARMTMWRDGGGPPFARPGRRIIYRPAGIECCPACPNHLTEIGGPRP